MKRVLKIIAIISLLTGFSSCTIDSLSNDPRPVSTVPEGYIRATLDLSVQKSDDIQTRASEAQEQAYDKNQIWALLVYQDSHTLVQAPVKAIPKDDQCHLMLRATKKPVYLILATGLNSTMNEYLGNPGNFSEGVTPYSTVFYKLTSDPVTAGGGGVPIGNGTYFHMSTAIKWCDAGTTKLNSTPIAMPFVRSVAKINVDASAITDRGVFALEGVTLINAAPTGSVLPPNSIPATPPASAIRYAEKTTGTNQLMSQIYLYENAGSLSNGTENPTKLIVRGKYMNGTSSYYRMDIVAKNGDGSYTPHNIKRNFCYTLEIDKIENAGYPTFDEALAAAPTNTGVEVTVTDPNAHDVVSNGHYFLGVSNSDFIVHGDDGQLTDILITTVTTDAPKEKTQTSITASNGVTLRHATTIALSSTGAAAKTDIYATISSTIFNGTIDLRVGNLTKRINIQRNNAILYMDNNRTYFADPAYVEANVVSGTEWVRLNSTDTKPDFNSLPVSLINPGGGIYVRCNATLDMNRSRSAEVYAHKANNQGRAKLLLFAKNIRYMSSTLPDVIDSKGLDVNGVSRFNATFMEAGGYLFSVGIFAEGSTTPLLEKEAPNTGTTEVVDIDLKGLAVTGSVNLPRMLELKYKVNGNWYETGKKIQQRTFLNVHILSVGENGLNINGDFGTQMGSTPGVNTYSAGIGQLLWNYTGSGKPIQNNFQLFNINNGGNNNGPMAYTNIGKVLRDNNIDILYCSLNTGAISPPAFGGPDPSQMQEILDWLDENPFRGFIYAIDQDNTHQEITKALFGVSHTSVGGGAASFSKLSPNDPYYNNPIYKAIMQGSYSTDPALHFDNPIDLRGTDFSNTNPGFNNYSGGVPLAQVTAAGFIPIFNTTINGREYVLFAVHPTRNIVMMGDRSWFDSSIGFLNPNGSLNKTTPGNYPKMVMNMWEWFINNVALGGSAGR